MFLRYTDLAFDIFTKHPPADPRTARAGDLDDELERPDRGWLDLKQRIMAQNS